ncbi:MAG TPA: substrate-binding domain-containing protein [Alphaproteobacteria bacterium]
MRIVLASLVAASFSLQPAVAADVKLLTTGAFKPVVTALVADYERQSGDKVTIVNDTAGALVRRIDGGETFDLVVLTPAAINDLAKAGKVAGGPTNLARVGVGVVVKEGAPHPDISSVDAFKRALLAAKTVAYIDPASGGSSGIYLDGLFKRLGIADAIKPKAVLVNGGLVAEHVVNGEAEIGVHQISEILAVKGAALVGPIPGEIQNYTVYAGAIGAAAKQPEAARKLLGVFTSEQAVRVLKDKGMEPPPG